MGAPTAAGDFVSLLTKTGSNNSYCANGGDLVAVTGLVSSFTYMYPLSSDPPSNKMCRRYRSSGEGTKHSTQEETLSGGWDQSFLCHDFLGI